MKTQDYRLKIKNLSDQLVQAQRPIQILDAIKWPHSIQQQFFADNAQKLPALGDDFYQKQALNFNPAQKIDEFTEIKRQIVKQLGKSDRLGKILQETADQYRIVIEMLQNRGNPQFMRASQQLYGSARDHLRGDRKSLIELSERLCAIFSLPAAQHLNRPYPKKIDGATAVNILRSKLMNYFSDSEFKVTLTDGIVSDASAGGDCIKVNSNARFSELDLQVLEVHEGWVHVGTTLNGRNQPWASWLSVGSPRITAIQEGLAVLIETLTFSSFPDRARRISDRVIAVDLAEQGADFLEVYRFFLNKGLSEHDCYKISQRVFRGGMLQGGACFTKDISYVKGFIEAVNFIRSAILSDVPQILPMLFVGKIHLDDLPVLYEHALEGLIAQPKYLPPMFRDLNGIYTWFGFSSGMSLVDVSRVQKHFAKLFAKLPDVTPMIGTHTKIDVEFD